MPRWLFSFKLTLLLALIGAIPAAAQTVTVSAAISLKETLTDIAADYQRAEGSAVEFNFGGSGQLEAQIQQGAPVDIFISASPHEMDELAKGDLVLPNTRCVLCENNLVLIVPPDAASPVKSFADLVNPEVHRIAIGEPKTVPAGNYAMQVLDHLHLAHDVSDRLIFGQNVRQVLQYVQRGEVDAAIVYGTDAQQAGQSVKVVATAEAQTHEPIVYPAVLVKGAKAGVPQRFLDYLQSEPARRRFVAHGFTLPGPATTEPTSKPAAQP